MVCRPERSMKGSVLLFVTFGDGFHCVRMQLYHQQDMSLCVPVLFDRWSINGDWSRLTCGQGWLLCGALLRARLVAQLLGLEGLAAAAQHDDGEDYDKRDDSGNDAHKEPDGGGQNNVLSRQVAACGGGVRKEYCWSVMSLIVSLSCARTHAHAHAGTHTLTHSLTHSHAHALSLSLSYSITLVKNNLKQISLSLFVCLSLSRNDI